jgi:hypothetical protein
MTGNVIRNGVPWFDDRGQIVNAHGACIVEEGGLYYLFGEYKTDDKNTFVGFSCYSSPDLATWTFERLVLPQQPDGLLGPDRIGERVKVMKCPSTGRFMMYMHTDDLAYTDPHIGLAVSDTIAGEYAFLGTLEFDGGPLRRWDMGTFQDQDGSGYLLLHEGDIYRLSDDYSRAEELVASGIAQGGESPAMLRQDGQYFVLFSNKTSWERNDNYYLSAPSIRGPWTHRGLFAPEGSLTHNSQCSFVFPLRRGGRTVHLYMGDRWSFPHQASAATQVWLPLDVSDGALSLPRYLPSWTLGDTAVPPGGPGIGVAFASNVPGTFVDVPFTGTRAAVGGVSNKNSGYALIEVFDVGRAEPVNSSIVDFYSLVPDSGIRYVTPLVQEGGHRLRVTVTGHMPVWTDKTRTRFGAHNSFVTVENLTVLK